MTFYCKECKKPIKECCVRWYFEEAILRDSDGDTTEEEGEEDAAPMDDTTPENNGGAACAESGPASK